VVVVLILLPLLLLLLEEANGRRMFTCLLSIHIHTGGGGDCGDVEIGNKG